MLNHIVQSSSRLQTISASTNGITSFLNLRKRNPFYYNININNYKDYDRNENIQCNNINERTISLAAKHLRISTPSPLLEFKTSKTFSFRSDYDFLSAFGILKSVPSPSNKIFSNKKRYILFNPPSPKSNILDEQYYINKHKFGDKKANKNDFIIMPTVFISDYMNEDMEIYEDDG
ncbi:unnamed protein product [Rhizophagus irregularis]|nr:unnamed protein product [Rhizophagus irregularis]